MGGSNLGSYKHLTRRTLNCVCECSGTWEFDKFGDQGLSRHIEYGASVGTNNRSHEFNTGILLVCGSGPRPNEIQGGPRVGEVIMCL